MKNPESEFRLEVFAYPLRQAHNEAPCAPQGSYAFQGAWLGVSAGTIHRIDRNTPKRHFP
jgi:hypothetical protein